MQSSFTLGTWLAGVTFAALAAESLPMPALASEGRIATPEPLTLEEAVATAQHNSLAIQVSQAKLDQAQLQVSQTYAGLYPQLSLSQSAMSYRSIDPGASSALGGVSGGLGGLGAGLAGGSALGGGSVSPAFNLLQTQLTISQVLFDGFLTADALAIADASVKMSEVDRDTQVKKAGYDAANAYFGLLRAMAQRDLAGQNLTQAQAHLEVARRRERAGVGTKFDVLGAQSQIAAVQGQLRSAAHAVDLARLSLANALGEPLGNRPIGGPVDLAIAGVDLGRDLESAIESRGEVRSLVLKRRIDVANLDMSRKANYPKAQAQAQYSQQTFTTGRSLTLLAGLSWPLVDWGKAQDKVNAAELDVRQTDLSLAQFRRNLGMDIAGAILSRQDARDRVQIASQGLVTAQEAFRMSEIRFQSGVGTGFEVIDAQTALVQAQNTYIQATYDLRASEIRLAQALNNDLVFVPEVGGLNP